MGAVTYLLGPAFAAVPGSGDLGRSPDKTVTSNGVPVGMRIFEPRSETRNFGISIMLRETRGRLATDTAESRELDRTRLPEQ